MSVHTDRDTEGSGQTEVSDLDAAVLVNQEILGLHVSVEDSPLMTEQDALQQLKPVKLIQLAISDWQKLPDKGMTLSAWGPSVHPSGC